jgi:hypothetical protein
MFPQGSYTSWQPASPTDWDSSGEPKLVTGFDDRGFSTVRTIYPEKTPNSNGNGVQNNAAETAVVAAPAEDASAKTFVFGFLPWAIIIVHILGCVDF